MEKLKELQEWIEKLKKEGKLIIVEGKKDVRALAKLGITNVRPLKSPLFNEVEEIAELTDEVILLLDLDKEGKKIYGKMKKDLIKHGVKIDDDLREFLFRETTLRQIEGIDTYLGNL